MCISELLLFTALVEASIAEGKVNVVLALVEAFWSTIFCLVLFLHSDGALEVW
jgi:hypothetical protein